MRLDLAFTWTLYQHFAVVEFLSGERRAVTDFSDFLEERPSLLTETAFPEAKALVRYRP